ncbi:hypothetical protein RYX36_030799 [Vicia faba]
MSKFLSSADDSHPPLKKQKKKGSKVTSSQGTAQKETETATLHSYAKEAGPPTFGVKISERIGSNTSSADKKKSNKSLKTCDPLKNLIVEGTPSSPPNAGIAQNKGSATGHPKSESKDAEEQENSSPEADARKDGTSHNTGTSEEIEINEEAERSSDIEGFFEESKLASTHNQPSSSQPIIATFSEEERTALKTTDPLKYVKLMMDLKDSSPAKTFPDTSAQAGVGIKETSLDTLLQQVKQVVFDIDLFINLKEDCTAGSRIKKLISQIPITACPPNVGEALVDIQQLIDQVSSEFNRDFNAQTKLQAAEKAQSLAYEKAYNTYTASENLMQSKKKAQEEYNNYASSIQVWETQISELQERIAEAKEKQVVIQGLNDPQADLLAKESVAQVEAATNMDKEIAKIQESQAAIQYKLNLSKIKYARIKNNLPF